MNEGFKFSEGDVVIVTSIPAIPYFRGTITSKYIIDKDSHPAGSHPRYRLVLEGGKRVDVAEIEIEILTEDNREWGG